MLAFVPHSSHVCAVVRVSFRLFDSSVSVGLDKVSSIFLLPIPDILLLINSNYDSLAETTTTLFDFYSQYRSLSWSPCCSVVNSKQKSTQLWCVCCQSRSVSTDDLLLRWICFFWYRWLSHDRGQCENRGDRFVCSRRWWLLMMMTIELNWNYNKWKNSPQQGSSTKM